MRRKKLKASKRIVRYFKLHFGFREPFKVLMDGNFIHSMAQMKYDNLEDMVSTILGGKVKLFVPSCAMRELRDLAKQDKAYSAAVALARKFLRHKDACAPTESTHDILLKQVDNSNEQHWWLATQDRALWATVREDGRGAVPILYASATGLHLLPPSDKLKEKVTNDTMIPPLIENGGPTWWEINAWRFITLRGSAVDIAESDVASLAIEASMTSGAPEQALMSGALGPTALKPHKKQKHASAPNPLAVKKSSKMKIQHSESSQSQPRIRRKRQNAREHVG